MAANVKDFGARSDGDDDTQAIQKANNYVAARGGGTVYLPRGTYRAYGVQQDSCVRFVGKDGARIVHTDGTSAAGVIEGRVRSTQASIAKGSKVLTLRQDIRVDPGAVLAIRGAGGKSSVQRSRLALDTTDYDSTIALRATKGLDPQRSNHLFIEDEIISYDMIEGNVLLGVRRGLFRTKAVSHRAGAVVAQAKRLYAQVVSAKGKKLILDRPATATLVNTEVSIGSQGMGITGLHVDGNDTVGESGSGRSLVYYRLARWVSVHDSLFTNGRHGAISLDLGTRDSVIERNRIWNQGDVGQSIGAAIWLFRGAMRNTIRDNEVGGRTSNGIIVDDRTEGSTEFDAESRENMLTGNDLNFSELKHNATAGILIEGCSANRVEGNTTFYSSIGVRVTKSSQGAISRDAAGNSVHSNSLLKNNAGIVVSGSSNEFVRNLIRTAKTPFVDTGDDNRFEENRIEP